MKEATTLLSQTVSWPARMTSKGAVSPGRLVSFVNNTNYASLFAMEHEKLLVRNDQLTCNFFSNHYV